MPTPANARWLLRLYREDSLTPVVYENVKHVFWTNAGTVLTVAQYADDGTHHYFSWPRERFAWYQLERAQ